MVGDLNSFALRLLNFAENNVEEAISNASSRLEFLTEADGAIAVLKRTLHRGDEKKLFQLTLLGVFDSDFKSLANADKPELSLKLAAQRRELASAKTHF